MLLKPGERTTVSFEIDEKTISFWRRDLSYGPEPGEFTIMIGTSSDIYEEVKISYEKMEK